MGDLFDDIDLEQLGNSESPLITKENIEPGAPPVIETTSGPEEVKNKENEDPEGIELDLISGLGEIDNIKEDDKEGNSEQASLTPAKNSAEGSPSPDDKFTSFASALTEAGVFSSLEKEDIENIKDVDSLLDAVKKQIKVNEYASLTDQQKHYLDALKEGVPHPTYAQSASKLNEYKQVTDEHIKGSVPLQKELIRRNFINKNFSVEEAEKYASRVIEGNDAVEEANLALKNLVAHEESIIQAEIYQKKQEKLQQAETEKEELATLKSKVYETSEILPGIRITSVTKDKIYNSLTTPVKLVEDSPINEVLQNYMENSEYKIRLHALHTITNGFTDFSKFERSSKSKAVLSLKDALDGGGNGSTGTGGSSSAYSMEGQTAKKIAESLGSLDLDKQ